MRFDGDTKDVLQRARAAGVSRLTVIGTRAADSEAAVQLSENEEGVFCAVGIHPNDVDDVEEADDANDSDFRAESASSSSEDDEEELIQNTQSLILQRLVTK